MFKGMGVAARGIAAGLLIAVAACPFAAAAQSGEQVTAPPAKIDPKVTTILKAACDTLSAAQSMSFTAVDTYERAARNGQPLYYTVLNQVTLQRPNKLRVIKLGDGIPDEFYYDGKTMAAYVPSADLIAVEDAPPTIDEMLDAAWNTAAIYFPFADVIVSKPCAVFDQKLKSAFYVGQSVVVGRVITDVLALAGDDVQAELWIGTNDHLPRMIRIVYPNEPAHAHYQTDYSDWVLNGKVETDAFSKTKSPSTKTVAFEPPGVGATPRGGGTR